MPTITTVDAAWDTGVTLDAAELRRADTTGFLGDGSANGVRGGVVRHGDTSLAVSVNGSDQVTVQAGAFVVPAATGLGCYRGSLAAATSAVALTARNATNPRIDLVAVQVTGTSAVVKTIDGTPAASPSAPALPAQHIELARLTVPQVAGGAVTVDSTWRSYSTGLGGALFVETAARLPGSGNQKGQRATALDTGEDYRWNGTAWVGAAAPESGAWTSYTPTRSGFTTSAVSGRYFAIGKFVQVACRMTLSATPSGPMYVGLPFAALNTTSGHTGTATAGDAGTANYVAGVVLNTVNDVTFIPTPSNAGVFNATIPFGWVSGDTLQFSYTYERA